MIQIDKKRWDRVCQGDIYRDVDFLEEVKEGDGNIEVRLLRFPLVIVLTQDCDLHFFHENRRVSPEKQNTYLLSAIVAPLYNADHVRQGEHLELLGLTMDGFNSKLYSNLQKNNNKRYHYLELADDNLRLGPLIIDFKHYFTVKIEYLERLRSEKLACKLGELYREDISHRFAFFLSRIALPDVIR